MFSKIAEMKNININTGLFAALIFIGSFQGYSKTFEPLNGLKVIDPVITCNNDTVSVSALLDFSNLKVKSDDIAEITPVLIGNNISMPLESTDVFGRNAWLQAKRYKESEDCLMVGYKKSDRMTPISYSSFTTEIENPDSLTLIFIRQDRGCCRQYEALIGDSVADYYAPAIQELPVYSPELVYWVTEVEEVKTRELSGKAYIDFPVNQTVLYPDYRNNPVELTKIIATIDSVKNDQDIEVTSVAIKGFASPEGSYAHNAELAQGRTLALKNYVENLYHFPAGFIKMSYEPEDWEGLREYLISSSLPHRDEILMIVDNETLEPDTKDNRIKSKFPSDYKFLLQNVYPALRHSDYSIEYTIRSFTDLDEIKELLATAPQKLSLDEVYLLANSFELGSDEYNEVMETAALLFPNNDVATYNAANVAINRKDYKKALQLLDKLPDSGDTYYLRGVIAAYQGNVEEAREWFLKAKEADFDEADEAIEQLENSKINIE